MDTTAFHNEVEHLQTINPQDTGDKTALGLRMGLDIDWIITGIRPGELFVLAGRPSVGKTSLMMNIAQNMVIGNEHASVGIFSLELPAREIVARMLSSLARFNLNDLQGQQIQGDLKKAVEQLCKSKILIDDTGSIDITNLCANARRMKAKHDVKVIFIDYLQLIKGQVCSNASRENEIAMISGSLKAMAKELNIPVVVLAQLNRQAEQHGDTPKLSNLRESRAIEQDADVVALLHRDRKQQYDLIHWLQRHVPLLHRDRKQQYDQKDGEEAKPLSAELIIAKNRHGSCGTVNLNFFPEYFLFENALKTATPPPK